MLGISGDSELLDTVAKADTTQGACRFFDRLYRVGAVATALGFGTLVLSPLLGVHDPEVFKVGLGVGESGGTVAFTSLVLKSIVDFDPND